MEFEKTSNYNTNGRKQNQREQNDLCAVKNGGKDGYNDETRMV